MFGTGCVPFFRKFGLGLGLGGATAPISGPRLGVWRGGVGQDVREIVEGARRISFEAQRDIAEQEIGIGIRLAVEHTVLRRDLGGEIDIAGSEETAGNDLALVPPGGGVEGIAGIGAQDRNRGVGHLLFATPSQFFVKEAGIVLHLRRHAGNEQVGRRGLQGQGEASFGQGPIIRRDPRQHSPRRLDFAIPQQPVEPVFIVRNLDYGTMTSEKVAPVERIEIAVDPGRAQRRRAAGNVTRFNRISAARALPAALIGG